MPSAESIEIGLILAGGRSTRMGRDKAALRFADGTSLLERAVALVRAAGVADVWISGPGGVLDETPGLGPVGGIATAAARLADGARLLVVPVDMPALRAEHLRRLLTAGATAHFRGHPLPACFVVDAAFRERLRVALEGARSVRALIAGAREQAVADAEAQAFANVNTPAEWATLLSFER